jgi:diguanylate cyclase (GGDEF)-like protein
LKTQSLSRVFLNAGVLAGICLALAGICAYLLAQELAHHARASFGTGAWFYTALLGIAVFGVFAALFRLYRVVAAAVRHDVRSLTRMFRDVREGEVRESYPIALREFAETVIYLRASGRKLVLEKKRLKNLGLMDHLSQLSNRRHFERQLAKLFEARKSKGGSALLLIDVDHFKSVNDEHGHDCGDALIVKFSRALRVCVRHSDFLARLGGDEFCIIYPYTSADRALKYAQRLRQQLPREITLMDDVVHMLRWTGGLSAMTDADMKFDDVLWRADKALMQAKEVGRNNTKVYDPRLGPDQAPRVIAG